AESRQIVFAKSDFRDERRGSVSSTHRSAVSNVVFETGSDTAGISDIRTFVAANHGHAHCLRKIWVFTVGFIDSRPQRLPADVEYRREVPRNISSACLCRSNLCSAQRKQRIPGGRHRQRLREERASLYVVRSVNRIDAVQYRNVKPRFFGGCLNLTDN